MSSISFTAHGRCARATVCEPITTGSVGLSVSFAFDAAWSGLQKTAIFRGSGMAVDLVLSGDAATVPPEVLTIPGGDLRVGVWGADPDGNVIIPTVWATVGEIVLGSAPSGIDPQPPTPSWAAQVQEISLNALNTANSVREDADAGEFDGATYTPAVSAVGDLSWTNDKGKPNPPTVNIKGPEGQPGQTGATPDLSIGTVETLPPGSPATATITGTAENPVLSFGIPQGQQGAPGEVTQAEFDELADEVAQQKSALTDTQASLATVEPTSTASSAYAVGELLVYNNRLYRVASVIAAGATLTPGTNITLTTVEGELDELETGIADLQNTVFFPPEVALSRRAYAQNMAPATVYQRTWSIKNGIVHVSTPSSVSNSRTILVLSGTPRVTGDSLSGYTPAESDFGDIWRIKGANALQVLSDMHLSEAAIVIYLRFFDSTDTMLLSTYINVYDYLRELPFEIPETATKYVLLAYARNRQTDLDNDIFLSFKQFPATTA